MNSTFSFYSLKFRSKKYTMLNKQLMITENVSLDWTTGGYNKNGPTV